MQIAICDDEKEICVFLAKCIGRLYPEAEIAKYSSGDELLLAHILPDILFLDIQMDGTNGMEIAKKIRRKNKKMVLVFVTAMEEYVFQAFDVGAFHYLVKPLSDDKFDEVFGNALLEIGRRNKGRDGDDGDYMMIQAGGVHTKILFKDIIYAEVFNRKVIIHTINGDTEYYGKLSDLEKKVGEDFFRPHRSYLIHFKYVLRYDAVSAVMENGTALIAKQNYPKFVKQYLKYNQRKGREIR